MMQPSVLTASIQMRAIDNIHLTWRLEGAFQNVGRGHGHDMTPLLELFSVIQTCH